MLKNENIVCISYSTWEGPYTKSVVQLMSLLAVDNNVLFVEYPFTWKDLLSTWRGKQHAPAKRMLGLEDRLLVKHTTNSRVSQWVLPPILPFNTLSNRSLYKLFLRLNTLVYRQSIRKALRRLGWENPITIVAYNPIFGETLSGKLSEKLNVYYCYDGYPTDARGIKAWEADLRYAKIADGIIVTSDYLTGQKLSLNPKVETVKNGVDFQTFVQAAKSEVNSPTQRRKVGYIGSIDQRFDIETVRHVVENLPEFDFEFIGDIRNAAAKAALENYPNVSYHSPIKPNEVPARLKQCDVGIIPYICNDINKNIYPLKINEYLAVGVPVVITKFADLPEFAGQISVAETKEQFKEALVFETSSDSAAKIQERINFAKSNSWEARAEQFGNCLAEFLKIKTAKNL